MSQEKKNRKKRKFSGVVVSDKMDKTVVVKVDRSVMHPKYRKSYRVAEKYKAHDGKNEYKKGDQVVIEETRPLSRQKRWKVTGKITK